MGGKRDRLVDVDAMLDERKAGRVKVWRDERGKGKGDGYGYELLEKGHDDGALV